MIYKVTASPELLACLQYKSWKGSHWGTNVTEPLQINKYGYFYLYLHL